MAEIAMEERDSGLHKAASVAKAVQSAVKAGKVPVGFQSVTGPTLGVMIRGRADVGG